MRLYNKELECGCLVDTETPACIPCYCEYGDDEELKSLHEEEWDKYLGVKNE